VLKNLQSLKRISLIFSLTLTLIFIGGCNSSKPQEQTPKAQEQKISSQTTYPLTFRDDSGKESTLSSKPQRIVSFVPATTETLFALGLEGKVIAVTKYDNNPQGVQQKVEYVFEDSLNPNVEQILKLNPDMIVLGMHDDKTVNGIRNLKIPVIQLNPQSLEATYETIDKLGQITDTQEQAKKLINGMKQKEKIIADKVNTVKEADRVKVWLEVDPNLFTAGQGTFLNELLTKAGGINIASEVKDWGQYSEEQIIAKNPQVILDTYSYYMPNVKETISARKAWQTIEAVKSKKVFDLDSDMVTRPGPRIVDGLESITKVLYPDLFK
jgi:iron complex transport system substrate-binding protein